MTETTLQNIDQPNLTATANTHTPNGIRAYGKSVERNITNKPKAVNKRELSEYGLFPDLADVPFPNPQTGKHTLIDLFAGIGGIRLPLTS